MALVRAPSADVPEVLALVRRLGRGLDVLQLRRDLVDLLRLVLQLVKEISMPRYFVRTSSTACADFGSTKYPDVSPMRHTACMSYSRPRPRSRPLAPTIPAPGSPREKTTPYFSISFTSSPPVAAPRTRGFVTMRPMP